MIHIGKKIEAEVRRQNANVTKLGYDVNLTRSMVYQVFKRNSIDASQLLTFSFALKHDFFKYYTEAFEDASETKHQTPITRNEIESIRNTLKELDASLKKLASKKEITI